MCGADICGPLGPLPLLALVQVLPPGAEVAGALLVGAGALDARCPSSSDAQAVVARATMPRAATRGRASIGCTLRGATSPAGVRPRVVNLTCMDLTHVDSHGAARMVDVSAKDVTVREAVAAGRLTTTPEVVGLLRRDGLPKGDALAVARI